MIGESVSKKPISKKDIFDYLKTLDRKYEFEMYLSSAGFAEMIFTDFFAWKDAAEGLSTLPPEMDRLLYYKVKK